jgi:hypothetical protein
MHLKNTKTRAQAVAALAHNDQVAQGRLDQLLKILKEDFDMGESARTRAVLAVLKLINQYKEKDPGLAWYLEFILAEGTDRLTGQLLQWIDAGEFKEDEVFPGESTPDTEYDTEAEDGQETDGEDA